MKPTVAHNRSVALWLLFVSCTVVGMVTLGGWVRLTGSGLSMVDWHVVTGVVPPLSEADWERTFGDYKRTPEYRKINIGMTMDEYRAIYYREYIHRIAGRIAGLGVALPLLLFLIKGVIPWRRSVPYLGIGVLFAFQGLMGWIMVQSGLVDMPHVSHLRLTLHLMLAVALLGACLWLAFDRLRSADNGIVVVHPENVVSSPTTTTLSLALLVSVCVQIALGGLMAGLKAGHVSATFPQIRGQWVPDGLGAASPWLSNLFANALTVHFEHRWFAFVILILGVLLWRQARRDGASLLPSCVALFVAICCGQILLGIATIVWGVPISTALIHQLTGLALFGLALFIHHQVLSSRHDADNDAPSLPTAV